MVRTNYLSTNMENELVDLIKKLDLSTLTTDFASTVRRMACMLIGKYKLDAKLISKEWYQSFLLKYPEITKIVELGFEKKEDEKPGSTVGKSERWKNVEKSTKHPKHSFQILPSLTKRSRFPLHSTSNLSIKF